MKKFIALFLIATLCLGCLTSCGYGYKRNRWFSKELREKCLVNDLPIVQNKYVRQKNLTKEDVYVNFTTEEYEAYVTEIFEYLKSQNYEYFGTRDSERKHSTPVMTEGYYFKSATELSEFYVDGAYRFVYSNDINEKPVFSIIIIKHSSKEGNLEMNWKDFSYNTVIELRYGSELPLSGDYTIYHVV